MAPRKAKKSRPSRKAARASITPNDRKLIIEDASGFTALRKALQHDRAKTVAPVSKPFTPQTDAIEAWLDRLEEGQRLGLGEYVFPGILDRFLARHLFFQAIKRVAPKVIDALHGLLPKYVPVEKELLKKWGRTRGAGPQTIIWDRWKILETAAKRDTTLNPLADALRGWAAEYNLNDTWILDAACWNLEWWRRQGAAGRRRRWRYPGQLTGGGSKVAVEGPGMPRIELWAALSPQLPAYNPLAETSQVYLKRACQDLRRYMRSIEQTLEQNGFRKTLRKRGHWQDPGQHFDWIVSYQVCEESYHEIARTRTVAADAVKALAKLLGLTLRRSKRGRPLGSKDKWARRRSYW